MDGVRQSLGLLVLVLPLIWSYQPWKQNLWIKTIEDHAKRVNLSDCWICNRIAPTTQGVPWEAWPMESGDWAKLEKKNTTQLHYKTQNNTVALVGNRSWASATLCLNASNVTGKAKIDLGKYGGGCNLTWPVNETGSGFYDQTRCEEHFKAESNTTLENPLCKVLGAMSLLSHSSTESQGYLFLPQGLWFLCGTRAYKGLPPKWKGVCTIGEVAPALRVIKTVALPQVRLRNKRDTKSPLTRRLGTAITRGLIPQLGVGLNYRDLHVLSNWTEYMFNLSIQNFKNLNKEVGEMRYVVLQNREALDQILAASGGVCALLHEYCCVYISDYQANISHTIREMEESVRKHHESWADSGNWDWSWLWSWLPGFGWIKQLLMIGLGVMILLIVMCCCVQCVPLCMSQMRDWLQLCKPNREAEMMLLEFETRMNKKRGDCEKWNEPE